MKVCYITAELSERHGWGRLSREVVTRMPGRGVEPLLLCSRSDCSEELPDITRYPVLTPVIPPPRGMLVRSLGEALRIARYIGNCDLVHCLVEPYILPAAWAAQLLGKPYVVTGAGTHIVAPLGRRLWRPLFRQALQGAARVICISRYTENRLLTALVLKNTTVVPLGVNVENFQMRRECPGRGDGLILLSVGPAKQRKGYQYSIEAVALVRDQIPNVRYYIIGDTTGPGASATYYQNLQELIAHNNLQGVVTFLGEVSDQELIKWYNLCDIFLLASVNRGDNFEGFGLVHLEANACGVPAIGSRDCGFEEPIIDGYNGLLVPQRDSEAIAQAILRLARDPELARQMGQNAREQARRMSWEATADRLIEVYKKSTEFIK
jgi:glycosyltransferase involved in cell wall biosynthesis